MKTKFTRPLVALVALIGFGTALYASDDDQHWKDFGKTIERALQAKSERLFGIRRPLRDSARRVSCLTELCRISGFDLRH